MSDRKVCESAFVALKAHRGCSNLYGAALADRTEGVTHWYLVRGRQSRKVVVELERQLDAAGRMGDAPTRRQPADRRYGLLSAAMLTALGLVVTILGGPR